MQFNDLQTSFVQLIFAQRLSRANVGLHATLSIKGGVADRKVALLHQLAARGLLGWARKIEKEKGNVFAADGLSADDAENVPDDETPLSMALRCGHGDMALWLLKKGGIPSENGGFRWVQRLVEST